MYRVRNRERVEHDQCSGEYTQATRDEETAKMDLRCVLREANGDPDAECDGANCIYWRALSHLGEPVRNGCAVEHSGAMGDETLMKWLLTVKERLKDTGMAIRDEDRVDL
jgi:hypothetical protein